MLNVDRSWNHARAAIVLVFNYYLLSWVWDSTVIKDEAGRYHPVEILGPEFYAFSLALFLSCLGSAFLIRYASRDIRWGARIFVCILPAAAGLYVTSKALGYYS